MRNMRLSAIGSAFLLACLGISCCCERQEQVQKPSSMTITMSSTGRVTDSYHPLESASTAAEVCVENVAIETDTLTCTADTALFNKETGQLALIGDVVIRTADGIEFTAEEVVLKGKNKGIKHLYSDRDN
jgi:lipopolysaccharide assembly outer membrane protein LptD (OstA)